MITSLIALLALQGDNVPPVVSLKLVTPHVTANKAFTANLVVKFADGLHGYQNPPSDQFEIPVTVKLKSGEAKLIKIGYPKGADMTMPGDTKPTKVYSGSITIPLSFKAGKHLGPVVVTLNYQQCTGANCFPPSAVDAKADLSAPHKG
jgi:hypothetical protein